MEILGIIATVAEVGSFVRGLISLADGVRSELKYSSLRAREREEDLSQLSSTLLLFHEAILDPISPSKVAESARSALRIIHRRLEDLQQYLRSVAPYTGKPLLHRAYHAFRGVAAEQEVLKKLAALETVKTTLALHVSLCMGKTLSQVHELICQSSLTTTETQSRIKETYPMEGLRSRRSSKGRGSKNSTSSDGSRRSSHFLNLTNLARSAASSVIILSSRKSSEGAESVSDNETPAERFSGVLVKTRTDMGEPGFLPQWAAGQAGVGNPATATNHQHIPQCECSTESPIAQALAAKIASSGVIVHRTNGTGNRLGHDFDVAKSTDVADCAPVVKDVIMMHSEVNYNHVGMKIVVRGDGTKVVTRGDRPRAK